MHKMIYLDNLLLRRLVLFDEQYQQVQRERLMNFYKSKFGISCNLIRCPYLFLEFIGCTKKHLSLKLHSPLQLHPEISLKSITRSQIKEIDKSLKKTIKMIRHDVRKKLIANKYFLNERLNATLKRAYKDEFPQKIINKLFSQYIDSFHNDFTFFLNIFCTALTWDVFVTLEANDLKILRERQLGFWLQNYNPEYPFGKIIDDLSMYYDHSFPQKNFFLQASRDMVDSKIMTLPVTGYPDDGIIRRVDVVTFDTNVTAQRAKLALGTIKNIEESLGIFIPKKFGKIFCLSETGDENDPFNIEIIQNQYIIEL